MKENCQSKWIKKCKYAWSVPTTLLVLASFCFSQKILVMLKSSILATINHVMDLQDIIRLPVPLKDLSQKSSYIYRSPLARKYRHFIWSVVLVLNTHFQDTYACVSQPCLLFFFFLLKKQDMMVTLIFYLFLD